MTSTTCEATKRKSGVLIPLTNVGLLVQAGAENIIHVTYHPGSRSRSAFERLRVDGYV